MKITFLKPGFGHGRSADAMQPLVFGILSALTPHGMECRLIDERLEALPETLETDLVAITVETFSARHSYALADRLRSRGIRVVMGGFHPTLLPEEASGHADALVIGDAESVWPTLCRDAAAGTLRARYQGESPPSLEGLRVDRSLFAGRRYVPLQLVQAGRGCRYHCDFCSIHAAYGAVVRQRPVAELAEEISRLPRQPILFVDDNLFGNRDWCRDLFEAMIPLKRRWCCQISLDIATEPDLVELLRRSGCFAVLIGFESLHPGNLRQMRKGWNLRHGDYAAAIEVFRRAGIMVIGTFVFGYDADTPECFERTLAFAMEQRFFLANFNPLTPTPGTALYERLRDENRLLPRLVTRPAAASTACGPSSHGPSISKPTCAHRSVSPSTPPTTPWCEKRFIKNRGSGLACGRLPAISDHGPAKSEKMNPGRFLPHFKVFRCRNLR